MRLQSKKLIAVLCALAMIISVFPVQADAAAKPKFVKNYTVLYENSTGKGVYTYTVTNLTKGQRVKWSLSGTGKSYAKLNNDIRERKDICKQSDNPHPGKGIRKE